MTHSFAAIREWRNVDVGIFRNQIVARNQPAVLRGLVSRWPAVAAGLDSPRALVDYLKEFDRGQPVGTLLANPAVKGNFFYDESLRGLNFERRLQQISTSLDQLLAHLDDPDPPGIAIQSAPIPENLPGFAARHVVELLASSVVPRIWIGNGVTVRTHFDQVDNLACVVGGRRRFVLFAPEQLPNLYVGPFEFTPAGTPVSMVSVEQPDLVRYPRFEHALAAAQVAELGPGDAIYIPYYWWHHVQSLEKFNVLVNYWWNDTSPEIGMPFDVLLHGLLTLRELPPTQRAVWRAVFDHYVFQTDGDPAAHLAPEQRGILGPITPEQRAQIRAALVRALGRP